MKKSVVLRWVLQPIIQGRNVQDHPIVRLVKTANTVSIVLKMVVLAVFVVSQLLLRV
jgi:hypothetical protein